MKNNKLIADYISVEEAVLLADHLTFADSMLAVKIYKNVMAQTFEEAYAAGAVFRAGYIAGKRAEREKRRSAFRNICQIQQSVQEQYDSWLRQAEALKVLYPAFDLCAELENPQFRRFLRGSVPMEQAYILVHWDNLVGKADRNDNTEV